MPIHKYSEHLKNFTITGYFYSLNRKIKNYSKIITKPFWNVYRIVLATAGIPCLSCVFNIFCKKKLAISCKIFEPLGFTSRIQQLSSKLGSTPFKDVITLVPKLADPLGRLHPSLFLIRYSWSRSAILLYYIYSSVRWNKLLWNQISCQHVSYYCKNSHDSLSLPCLLWRKGSFRWSSW